jgi:hypothetical protein
MKIELKFFKVTVTVGEASAFLVVASYFLDQAKRFMSYDFYELGTSFGDEVSQIPVSRPPTFKEELRAFAQASTTSENGRTDDPGFIEKKLREAYGTNAIVTVNEIMR